MVLLLLLCCVKHSVIAEVPVVRPAPALTILSVNDTYRIEGLPEAGLGGLARLRSLRVDLEARGPVLVLHAGDLLYPSPLSSAYSGRQMVDVLSLLDGDPDADDASLFVTFGNHEFDRDDAEDAAELAETLRVSGFPWISSNISWTPDSGIEPLVDNTALVRLGQDGAGQPVTVGLLGLTGSFKQPAYVDHFADPVDSARAATASLRAAGADLVVAVAHLDVQEGVALLDTLGPAGPDLVVGGHEHSAMILQSRQGRYLVNAAADAASVVVTDVFAPAGGRGWTLVPRLQPLDGSVPQDPQVQARIDHWLSRYADERCAALDQPAGCLDAPLGCVSTPLVGEEIEIRNHETSLGSWAADLARGAFADQGAQVALINAGGLRLNKNLPANTTITQAHLDALLPYPMETRLLRLTGQQLQAAIAHSVASWPGAGRFLQVSGLAFRHDSTDNSVSELSLLTAQGPVPVPPDQEILVVTVGYLAGGGDGYDSLSAGELLAEGPGLRTLLTDDLARAGTRCVAPAATGQICQTSADSDAPSACLLP